MSRRNLEGWKQSPDLATQASCSLPGLSCALASWCLVTLDPPHLHEMPSQSLVLRESITYSLSYIVQTLESSKWAQGTFWKSTVTPPSICLMRCGWKPTSALVQQPLLAELPAASSVESRAQTHLCPTSSPPKKGISSTQECFLPACDMVESQRVKVGLPEWSQSLIWKRGKLPQIEYCKPWKSVFRI